MKANLLDKNGKIKKEINMPKSFSFKIRADILAKAVEAEKEGQPVGAMKGAGAGYSASGIIKKKRHDWKGSYGKGISRVPRKIMSRHGASFNWIGATVASARGGRKPHAPRAEKNQFKKINKKEMLIAFNSGFAGTVDKKSLEKKYGKIKSGFIFSDEVLKMKTKAFYLLLEKVFGTLKKIKKIKSIRAGKGKIRGRKYKSNAGLLFVIGSNEKMKRKGIEIVCANNLLLKNLAPNGEAGRVACYTEKALGEIEKIFGGKK